MVIENLVCDGGPFEGFPPFIQGDNYGPHQDKKNQKGVVSFCYVKKWLWEPQGPKIPHMNIMCIVVFNTIPCCHSHLIQYLRGM